jgi:peptide/nickel transport system substrate-binding protein
VKVDTKRQTSRRRLRIVFAATVIWLSVVTTWSPAAARDGVVATGSITNLLDPYVTQGSSGADFAQNVFDTLIDINPTPSDGRGRHVPALATSWKVAPDGRSIDFTLREGVFFHHGEPLTADDVKFSVEHAIAPETRNPYLSTWLSTIAGVDIIDPRQVRVNLKSAWAGTLDALAARGQIVPKAYYEKVGKEGFAAKPVGSGPFIFVGQRPGDRIELKAFDKTWGPKPSFDRLIWRAIPDVNTRVAMLASGEADIISDVPPSIVSTITGNGGQVGYLGGGIQRFLVINAIKGRPLADQRVRLALNLAIDRKAVTKAIFGRDISLLAGPLSSDQLGGKAAEPYPYDPEKAKSLLAEAGYSKGFAMEVVYNPGRFVDDPELLPALISYWKKIGITTTLKAAEYSQWLEQARRKTFTGLLSYSKGTGSVADPISAFDRHIACGGLYSSYCNQELDAVVKSAAEVVDEGRLQETFSRAQRLAHDDAAQVFLYDPPAIVAWRKGLNWKSEYGFEVTARWTLLVPADGAKQ